MYLVTTTISMSQSHTVAIPEDVAALLPESTTLKPSVTEAKKMPLILLLVLQRSCVGWKNLLVYCMTL